MADKRIKQEEFIRQHTLTPEQLKKLLEGKLERARQYFEADKKTRGPLRRPLES